MYITPIYPSIVVSILFSITPIVSPILINPNPARVQAVLPLPAAGSETNLAQPDNGSLYGVAFMCDFMLSGLHGSRRRQANLPSSLALKATFPRSARYLPPERLLRRFAGLGVCVSSADTLPPQALGRLGLGSQESSLNSNPYSFQEHFDKELLAVFNSQHCMSGNAQIRQPFPGAR